MEASATTSDDNGLGGLRTAFDRMRAAFARDPDPPLEARVGHLKALRAAIVDHKSDFVDAVAGDFGGRSDVETLTAEIWVVLTLIDHTLANLGTWMRPRRRATSALHRPGWGEVRPQPLGVVGVIAPWNYPIQLALGPVASALAAGNRVLLKPSELTPRTSALLADLVAATFPSDLVHVVLGDARIGEAFSRLPFDHLFFTGSTAVGRKIMAAAAENLTPVTLELGGKSPALVHPDFPVTEAAERITFGKMINAGQTCIAPDYVLVHESRRDALSEAIRASIAAHYPTFVGNRDYTSIVNERHLARLRGMLDDARAKGARVLEVGPSEGRTLAPHLLLDPPLDAIALREEIFGPILPLVTYRTLEEAIAFVNARPRPLALYYFDRDSRRVDRVIRETHSGGVCVNDTLLHIVQEDLPFGGVGESGMGRYHGPEGFETFSHLKPVFHQRRPNLWRFVAPPYPPFVRRFLDWFVR